MKPLRTYISLLAISAIGLQAHAQEDSIALETKVLVKETQSIADSLKGYKKAGNLFVGVDLFNPIMSAFTDKQGAQAMVSYRVYKKWNAVLEVGYEKNHYDELDWNVDVNGIYGKIGFNWFVSQDYQDASNGFYTGMRFAYAAYEQTINQYPIRTSGNQVDQFGSLPSENVSSYWIELVGGARVKLLSNFYADVSIRPEIYVGSSKQEDIDPLVIPGYGKDFGPINFSVFWGITYKFF